MNKIKVPEGMLKAAQEANFERWHYDPSLWPNLSIEHREANLFFLEAALRWLSENPIVPTKEDWDSMVGENGNNSYFAVEWQRRMFLAPEPAASKAIEDLLLDGADFIHGQKSADEANKSIVEAYRRGQKEAIAPSFAEAMRAKVVAGGFENDSE